MSLGRWFTLGEMIASPTALRIGDPNAPSSVEIDALRRLVAEVLDPLRESLGRPVRVTSGYRSRAVNAAVGGAPTSAHMRGEAADIKADGLGAEALAAWVLALRLPVDTLIWYDTSRGGHVHITHATSGAPRLRLYHAPAAGGLAPWLGGTL